MSQSLPVTVAVRRSDGSVEQVRVGTATKTDQGFSLQLGELSIGSEPAPARRAAPSAPARSGAPGDLPTVFPNYGRAKGNPIAGASANDLEFYANGARRSLGDPSKARFHDKEKLLLQAIQAEQARQGGGGEGPPMADSGPEAESDDEAY
ncbi:MAG: hypothetical protein JST54_14925 [Deltaproteobacteria bacterium]|nr:hypothetical protein [Deltaproteobacteria bacterium]